MVNLKLKFWRDNYLQDVGRLQDESLRKTFQKKFNTKHESLKFANVEDGWNNFRKIICKVADVVLGKKVNAAARNISEKAICLKDKRRGLRKNYISYWSYENKTNVKKSGESIKIWTMEV